MCWWSITISLAKCGRRGWGISRFDVIASDVRPDDDLLALAKESKYHCCANNRARRGAACLLREPAAEPAVQFHQHEVDNAAEEAALFHVFHMTIGRCSIVLSLSLKSMVPTTCPFANGAVSCGSVRL